MKHKTFFFCMLALLVLHCNLCYSVGILNHMNEKVVHKVHLMYLNNLNNDDNALYTKYLPEYSNTIGDISNASISILCSYELGYDIVNMDSEDKDFDHGFHRLSMRVSNNKFEFVLGKQKINFGEAQILRIVDWYDTVNYFDVSAYTKGTTGALLKVYPDMESALWSWYNITNTYESNRLFKLHDADEADFGLRYERDFSRISSGLSFENIGRENAENKRYKGRRIALDVKADAYLGFWTEMQQYFVDEPPVSAKEDMESSLMTGADYTFSVGNGLYTMAEYRISSGLYDKFSGMESDTEDICLILDYPVSIMYSDMFYVNYHNSSVEDFMPEFTIMNSLKYTADLYILNLQTFLSYYEFDEKPELGIQISFLADF